MNKAAAAAISRARSKGSVNASNEAVMETDKEQADNSKEGEAVDTVMEDQAAGESKAEDDQAVTEDPNVEDPKVCAPSPRHLCCCIC